MDRQNTEPDSFGRFKLQLAGDLTTAVSGEICICLGFQNLIKERVASSDRPGLELLEHLTEKYIISEKDVSRLADALTYIGQNALAKRVQRYQDSIAQQQGDEDFFRVDVESDEEDGSINSVEDSSLSFDSFLKLVGLEDMFPRRLTLDNLCKIKDPKRHTHDAPTTSPHELFWEKLGSLDYRACSKKIFTEHSANPCKEISVRDFIFALLHCSDPFLRQDILEKMSACQLAVPVLLQGVHDKRSTFLIWSLRRIFKKWKVLNSTAVEYPIVTIPLFSVAFMRIGEIRQISKSLILNHLLGPLQGFRKHSYFLSKEDDSKSSRFSQGCVEGVWYLPSNSNNSEKLKSVTSILNLRGDSTIFHSATRFCCKAANLCIVFLAKRNQNKFKAQMKEMRSQNRNMKFVAIDDGRDSPPTRTKRCKLDGDWLFVRFFDMNDVCSRIGSLISTECDNYPDDQLFSLEKMNQRCDNIEVEEDNKNFRKARQYVSDICEQEAMKDLSRFKKEAFPLQNMWLEWVKIDKENVPCDTENEKSVEFVFEEMKIRKLQQRQEQLQCGLSPQMKIFKRVLDMAAEDLQIWGFFSSYLLEELRRIEEKNISGHRKTISELQRQIDNLDQQIKPKLNENSRIADKRSKEILLAEEEKLKKEREKLKSLRQEEMRQCRDKSLSFEYFLRELGQWYEAYSEVENTNDATIALLPALAAKLLVNGQALEIMDGDTGRVPLSWVCSLLTALIGELQDAPILVLCVIGVQSSGKSTLLNTMFGVRFHVRSGPCTRGLFLRVICVDDQYSEILKVKYIFLIDSEGIRSQERPAEDQYRFDNELVTLALCVSDVTILNISGDNIGPDMTGLLQIAAHALIRMKRVDLHSHCRIVQQRIGDITADEANKLTMTQIEDTLNKVISLAAEREGFGNRYQVFSDVFELMRDQGGENLQYFPSLWTGRPMSPPNELYSEIVTKVRERILADVTSQRIEPQFTVSTFRHRIHDVWMAVKDEKFLFNFTDSVRALEFDSLCVEFNKWITDMKRELIESLSDWERMILESEKDVEDVPEEIRREMQSKFEDYERNMRTAFDSYVTNHPRKDIMAKYNTWFDQNVKLAISDERTSALTVLENDIKTRELQRDYEILGSKMRYKLRDWAKTGADRLRSLGNIKLNEDETKERWNEMWSKWLKDAEKELSPQITSDECFEKTCEGILLSITKGMSINHEITKLIQEEGGLRKHSTVQDWRKYYPTKGGTIQTEEWFTKNEENLRKVTNESLFAIEGEAGGGKFDANVFHYILRLALQNLSAQTFSSEPPSILKAKIMLHICTKLFEGMLKGQRSYETYMTVPSLCESHRESIYQDFRAFLNGDDYIHRTLSFMYRTLVATSEDYIITYITNGLGKALFSVCNNERSLLILTLSYLCEENSYKEYIMYVTNQAECMQKATVTQIGKYCLQKTNNELTMRLQANEAAEDIITTFREAVKTASEQEASRAVETANDISPFRQWLQLFNGHLSQCGFTVIDPGLLRELSWFEVRDMNDFTRELLNYIDTKLKSDIIQKLQVPDIEQFQTLAHFLLRHGILHHLLSLVINPERICFEQCPFCGAPCVNTLPQHQDHYASTHIPRGISGKKHRGRLMVDDCEACLVSSTASYMSNGKEKPFKDYKDDYPSWVIKPKTEPAPSQSIYWKWVMAQHNQRFAKHYGCGLAEIPPSWRKITQNDAMQSINPRLRCKPLTVEMQRVVLEGLLGHGHIIRDESV